MCGDVTRLCPDDLCVVSSQGCVQTICVWCRHKAVSRRSVCGVITRLCPDDLCVVSSQGCVQRCGDTDPLSYILRFSHLPVVKTFWLPYS